MLSRGGADAVVLREFDLATQSFVGADAFSLPEAKTNIEWRDRDHLLVGTNFGPGSLTESGYARIVKLWTRGTPLASAKTIYEGKAEDVGVSPLVFHTPDGDIPIIVRNVTFFTTAYAYVG